MKKAQIAYKVNLVGEQDLSKLTKNELDLLVAYYIHDLQQFLLQADKAVVEYNVEHQKQHGICSVQ